MASSASRFTRPFPALISTVQWLIDPFVTVGTLIVLLKLNFIHFDGQYVPLVIITFLLSFMIMREADITQSWSHGGVRAVAVNSIISWGFIVAILLLLGYATESTELYSLHVMYEWFAITPFVILIAHSIMRFLLLQAVRSEDNTRTAVFAGVSELSQKLANRIEQNPDYGMRVTGYFEDRSPDRVGVPEHGDVLGKLADLPEYVKQHNIDIIYITLPITHEGRMMDLLNALYDSTASIYFVPDIFVFDLIQARIDDINGIPIVALCETPFRGLNGLLKRGSDIVFSLLILLLISPVLLSVAVAVKASSPGPVFFRQRRYGVDGDEITVCKFRSMTVCEDGDTIRQAIKGDQRITKVGAFIRKTSLDELPQFFNVLQGQMSVVGPRPHAVAHNEEYRKLIKGYMIRHKVKPGITGWAQVNGCRGETETVEKMKKRIEYDLAYLRNWSLGLDTYIILKTVKMMFFDRNAY
jgi:putative colanic acid biosynthesis UDP-glucose lipid carrier transferase